MSSGVPRAASALLVPRAASALLVPRAASALCALLVVASAGCQLVVNAEELEDNKCRVGQKRCGDRCVSGMDPSTGCMQPGCSPCTLPHANARCSLSGRCEVDSCIGDYDHCVKTEEGCETDLAHDPNHCGQCFQPCSTPYQGAAGCSEKRCTIMGCNPGFEDCNRQISDGCERAVGTDSDCLGCDLACSPGTHCQQRGCS